MPLYSELEGPPSKRQKLGCSPPPDSRPVDNNGPEYLPLSTRTYCVNIKDTDTEVYKYLMGKTDNHELSLVDCSEQSDGIYLRAKTPALKTHIELVIDEFRPRDFEYLSDCIGIPSTAAKSKSVPEQALAKYAAILIIHNSHAQLQVSVLWQNTHVPRDKVDQRLHALLSKCLDTPTASKGLNTEVTQWDVREFYDYVHVPPVTDQAPLRVEELQCTLYPFQDRATKWMLSREKVEVLPSGQLTERPSPSDKLPLDFQIIHSAHGSPLYWSRALGVICPSRNAIMDHYDSLRGGILAEAMGLGKTVEMIALMCTHTRSRSPLETQSPEGQRLTGATLIITPPTILEQWKQEIREHAPSLRVFHYGGIKAAGKHKDDIVGILAEQDVVLTTYNVIASEIYYVQEKPDRKLRNRPRRVPPKSPLTQLLWWRCLLDEAQMVESGVSNSAVVARLIPRVHAWVVTGTPLKQSHRDLYGLLLFLKHEPWSQSARIWDYLVFYHRCLLRDLISTIALRHSKEQVHDELHIPAQSRKVITMPFTAIEESHYSQMHYDMQQECGLDSAGAPVTDDWDPDAPDVIEKMRSWLQRLRQTCLHPEIGGRNRRALGKRAGGPLRTVAQVLDVMIDQTVSIIHVERRNVLMAKADQGRIFEHAREVLVAQNIFTQALSEATEFVDGCRADLAAEIQKADTSKNSKSKGPDEVDTDAEDDEIDSSLTAAKQRLRSALEIQHVCKFFLGNTYYQLKEREELKLPSPQVYQEQADPRPQAAESSGNAASAHSAEATQADTSVPGVDEQKIKVNIGELEAKETQAYEEAKQIRTELLTEVRRKATKRIESIRSKRDHRSFTGIPVLSYAEEDFGGIESRKLFKKLHDYCHAMNIQAEQFQDIRIKMVDMLCQVLIDEEEGVELTGEEYEDSTKHQEQLYVLMEMLRALFADRSDAISGQENLLLKQETKQFLRAAKEGGGPAPELMLRLLTARESLRIDPAKQGSLRGILNELRSLASSLEWQESTSDRARAELALVNQLLLHVQNLLAEQSKTINTLEQEVNLFRDTMNARLDYYRALQVISDMVAPIGKDEDVGKAADRAWVARLHTTEEAATKKLSTALAKKRYLLHLKNEQETDGNTKICTICQFEFEIGTLTVCGHQFCKECIKLWWSEHRNCPVCKRRLQLTDFYDVTYKPAEPQKENEAENDDGASSKGEHDPTNAIYSTISPAMLAQIRLIDLRGPSYGSKVDTIVRHILHLRKYDPGSKTVIFSQYRDFLDVLSRSLRSNDIIHSKFDDKDGIIDFKTNPANECFLLHAKAHAAGLNLVCASHVILCEPLINTAIELQAIARVHRIGQIRETCVWMYLIEDTVEEAIYQISVRRRLAHMDNKSGDASRAISRAVSPSRGEVAIEAANDKELQQADLSKMFTTGKTGGEMVDKEDLWQCLFGSGKKQKAVEQAGPSREFADLPAASDVVGARSEIARHLRAEAAERRMEP